MADIRTQTPEPTTTTRTTITAAQKQQLIDNLQNEVASRARKLRAQYALHARSLRDRLEMRINRIPHSLRKTTMEDLISRYSESLDGPVKSHPMSAPNLSNVVLAALKKSPIKELTKPLPTVPVKTQTMKGLKRTSTEMSVTEDKENVETVLDLPKKRIKTGNSARTKPSAAVQTNKPTADGRVISRKVDPSQVLSPRSHNSRTLPHSPIRQQQISPIRSLLARPVSPMKTMSVPVPSVEMPPPPLLAAAKGKAKAAPASRAASKQTATSSLRGKPVSTAPIPVSSVAAPSTSTAKQTRTRAASNASNASGTSAGTTIVKKAPAEKKRGVAARVAAGLAGAGSKRAAAAGAKKAAAASTQAAVAATVATNPSGRTLRSRK